jgi:surface protein
MISEGCCGSGGAATFAVYAARVLEALTDSNFQTACDAWVADPTTAAPIYGDIKFWDTSSVTDMSGAFKDAFSFNDDISAWDVSKVISMHETFNSAYAFNQDISAWDTSGVTTMRAVSNESITCCLSALIRALLHSVRVLLTSNQIISLSISLSIPLTLFLFRVI